jgi:hypothetical protein
MYSPVVRKALLALSVLAVMSLACGVTIGIAPDAGAATAENTPVSVIDPPTPTPEVFLSLTQAIPATPLVQPSPVTNTLVTFGRLSLEIPSSVAAGASGSDIAPVTAEDAAYWEKTPGHLQVSLDDYYILQGKFHQARIYVYPALEYAQLVPAAFESIHRLRNFLHAPDAVSAGQLPTVPFFNAAQVVASNVQPISFQNGSGIRFVTEYAQGFVSVNNQDLFYHFQGVTDDGNDYIVAVLPVTSPVLAETDDPDAALPAGGIPFPDLESADPNMQGYFDAVAALLDAQTAESFSPSLSQLDALIQSMWVAP